jgi:hypothetical protein
MGADRHSYGRKGAAGRAFPEEAESGVVQKIPTLYVRDPANLKRVTDVVTEGCEWVLEGEGVATEKFDGSACAVFDGCFYRRHRHKAENGEPPFGWHHWTGDPDAKSGHGWLLVDRKERADRYHWEAWQKQNLELQKGTYELVGPKVQKNPYSLDHHELWQHASVQLDSSYLASGAPITQGIESFLASYRPIEGVVWHHPDGRMAKIKRRDYGLPWPVK